MARADTNSDDDATSGTDVSSRDGSPLHYSPQQQQ
jgi:hypothetical protein